MGLNLAARFVVYAPAGARLGTAPYPAGFRVTDVFNDIGGGSLDYLASAPRAELLEDLCEIGVEVNDGTGDGQTWREITARMMRLKRGSSVIDEGRSRSYTLHSYGAQLGKMRMLREETLNEDSERILSDMTVGGVIKTLFDEAKTRGNVLSFDYDFTAATDSNGAAWGDPIPPVTLRYGDDLLSLLRQLADNGACDWRVVGRTLRLYKPDTLGTDRSSLVRLVNRVDFIEAPDDEDATEMAGRIGVIGDEGRTYEAISPSLNPWGLWEEVVNASGVKDIGGLQFIGEAEQRRRSAPRVQMTRRLNVTDVRAVPFISYGVGDTVTAPNDRGLDAPLRVRELQLSLDASGFSVNGTLNDRILERDIRDRRMWSGMLGGASGSSGGSGVPSKPDDKRTPKAPTGLVVSSVHLYDAVGSPFAVIDAQYVPVTQDDAGKPVEIATHELFGRRNAPGEPWRKITEADLGASRITYSPLPAGEEWEFKLRAVSRQGVSGPFGPSVLRVLAKDTTPPLKPSKPGGSSRLGQMIITWDGRDYLGGLQPVDFSHASVYMASTATAVGSIVGRMFPGGDVFVPDMQPYNSERWFYLVSVDTSGNTSPPSDRVSVITKPLVDTDVIGQVIKGANIVDGTVNAADKIIGNTITGGLIQALAIDAGHIKSNAITADKINAGAITGEKIAANTITGAKIQAGTITADKVILGRGGNLFPDPYFESQTSLSDAFAGDMRGWSYNVESPTLKYPRYTATPGLTGWRGIISSGMNVISGEQYLVTCSGFNQSGIAGAAIVHVVVRDRSGTDIYSQAYYPPTAGWGSGAVEINVPNGGDKLHVALVANNVTSGNVYFGAITVVRKQSAELIVDGAITTNKLAANSITGGKIQGGTISGDKIAGNTITAGNIAAGAITADKIQADAINGKTITGATINGGTINGTDIVTGTSGYNLRLINESIYFRNGGTNEARLMGYSGGISCGGYLLVSSGIGIQGGGLGVSGGGISVSAAGGISTYMSSTSLSANVYSGGNSSSLQRTSSMRKLKLDREEIEPDYRILDLVPRTWRDRAMVEENPDTERRVAGFVAEDLAAVSAFHDNAFDPLLEVDEDGRAIGIAYDRIPAYLLPLIKDMQSRLVAAEERIELLEAA